MSDDGYLSDQRPVLLKRWVDLLVRPALVQRWQRLGSDVQWRLVLLGGSAAGSCVTIASAISGKEVLALWFFGATIIVLGGLLVQVLNSGQ
jgi:hypothetical protein